MKAFFRGRRSTLFVAGEAFREILGEGGNTLFHKVSQASRQCYASRLLLQNKIECTAGALLSFWNAKRALCFALKCKGGALLFGKNDFCKTN